MAARYPRTPSQAPLSDYLEISTSRNLWDHPPLTLLHVHASGSWLAGVLRLLCRGVPRALHPRQHPRARPRVRRPLEVGLFKIDAPFQRPHCCPNSDLHPFPACTDPEALFGVQYAGAPRASARQLRATTARPTVTSAARGTPAFPTASKPNIFSAPATPQPLTSLCLSLSSLVSPTTRRSLAPLLHRPLDPAHGSSTGPTGASASSVWNTYSLVHRYVVS